MIFSYEELKARAFQRAADALHSFWLEQKDNVPRFAAVHSRIFDPLIYDKYIELNDKAPGRTCREHVVPCAYIRNQAFEMYWNKKEPSDVAQMVGRLLRIAYITKEQVKAIDALNKYTMPKDWHPDTGCILRRLDDAGVELVLPRDNLVSGVFCCRQDLHAQSK